MTKPAISANTQKILDILVRTGQPMTAYEILAKMNKTNKAAKPIAPTTVYRALDKLIKNNIIHKIESINSFVPCAETHRHRESNFAVCKNCNKVIEIHEHKICELLDKWAKQSGFKIEAEAIELSGYCKDCRM